ARPHARARRDRVRDARGRLRRRPAGPDRGPARRRPGPGHRRRARRGRARRARPRRDAVRPQPHRCLPRPRRGGDRRGLRRRGRGTRDRPAGAGVLTYWAQRAWLADGPAEAVAIETAAGRITSVIAGVPPAGAEILPGLVLPGLANAHSHAFHRALRGRTHGEGGTFWTWRKQMYDLAERLDPDSYFRLARAVYAEMALAGITCVGEFHYLHHAPGGRPYTDPNAMGHALIAAAAEAGIRITLLDALYLEGGFGEPLEGAQRRFGDGGLEAWANRVDKIEASSHAVVGAAVHSVRAVPAEAIEAFASTVRAPDP